MILCKYSRCFCRSVRTLAICNRATVAPLFGRLQLGWRLGTTLPFSKQKQLREPNCKTSHDDADDFLRPCTSTHALSPRQPLCTWDCRANLVKSRTCGKADSRMPFRAPRRHDEQRLTTFRTINASTSVSMNTYVRPTEKCTQ